MDEYIKREAVKKALLGWDYDPADDDIECAINYIPTADVVSREVFEQVKWERDTALETLEEHGLGLGQKADVAEVKHGEWKYYNKDDTAVCKNCSYEHYLGTYHQYATNYCPNCGAKMDLKEGA